MSDSDVESVLAVKFARLLPHLNERQRRLAVAAEVAAVGRGGVSAVARASGLSRPTVYGVLPSWMSRRSSRGGPGRPGAGVNASSDRSRAGRGVGGVDRSDQSG